MTIAFTPMMALTYDPTHDLDHGWYIYFTKWRGILDNFVVSLI